jgi:hypothetical protein
MNIRPEILCQLFMLGNDEAEGFTIIEDHIISSDIEDGGAEHEFVIREDYTGKFYSGAYSDWDIENTNYDEDDNACTGRVDFDTDLDEVYPEQIIKTIYKRK